jgi:hypothetical protein
MNPKVFISHASEDKGRFVLKFAEQLRAKGIDAWVDQWEIKPGDSLVDKIFEEGIAQAQAFIIVISDMSIKKPWVREELNAAVVKRIQNGRRLIPVVIDDCQVPESLASTLWHRVKNLSDIGGDVETICAAIIGRESAPPLGQLPGYATTPVLSMPGLTNIDSAVHEIVCSLATENGISHVDSGAIYERALQKNIARDIAKESLAVLDEKHFMRAHMVMGGEYIGVEVSVYGFDQYLRTARPDYIKILEKIIQQIINHELSSAEEISDAIGEKYRVVDHFFSVLENKNLLKVSRTSSGAEIYNPSPRLKRLLQGGEA